MNHYFHVLVIIRANCWVRGVQDTILSIFWVLEIFRY